MARRALACLLGAMVFAVFLYAQAGHAQGVDLSDRNADFRHRIMRPSGAFLKNCLQNFSDRPCKYSAYAFVLRTRSRPISEPEVLQNIPSRIRNFPVPLRNSILPQYELATSYCTEQDQAVLMQSLDFPEDRKFVSVTVVPEEIEHCFSGYDRGSEKLPRNFFLIAGHDIFARVECSTLQAVPNPTCQLTAYPSAGIFRIEIGPFAKRNLRNLILHAPSIIGQFIDMVPIEFPDDFVWAELPAKIRISEAAEKEILLSEEKLQ